MNGLCTVVYNRKFEPGKILALSGKLFVVILLILVPSSFLFALHCFSVSYKKHK